MDLSFVSCKHLPDSHQAFNGVAIPSLNTWNALMSINAKLGQGIIPFEVYHAVRKLGVKIGKYTYIAALKACTMLCLLQQGRLVHDQIIRNGFHYDVFVGSTLIDMYAKCGSLEEALGVLDQLPKRNVVSWGAMISGYVQHNEAFFALRNFEKMQNEGIMPNKVIYLAVLKALGSMACLRLGRLLHEQINEEGTMLDTVLGNTLIDMYAKCGSLEEACKVFKNMLNRSVVSWNAMISAFAQSGECISVFELFNEMRHEGLKPDGITFSSVLRACATAEDIHGGRVIHEQIIKSQHLSDIVVRSTLVDVYAKCGSLEEAQKVFDQLSNQNSVLWGTMISGYTQHEEGLLALKCFIRMQKMNIKADKVIYSSVLKACGHAGATKYGRIIHGMIVEKGNVTDVVVGTALMDMYAKCGCMNEACKVFNGLSNRDCVVWDAMLAGYANNGYATLAEQCFNNMQREGIKPNKATFANILISCSRVGLVDEGCYHFISMRRNHGFLPGIQHYNCMIDLLGRAACWNEVQNMLLSASLPNIISWVSLLNACRMHGNVELGMECFDKVVNLNPDFPAGYLLMLDAYAGISVMQNAVKVGTGKHLVICG